MTPDELLGKVESVICDMNEETGVELIAREVIRIVSEDCATVAEGWKDSCDERGCGHTVDMIPEEVATLIRERLK